MSSEKQYKYNIVINYIMKYIQENELSDGDKLPTEQQLSRELHVSRVSIQQGIKKLEKDGFVYRIQGSGTYVRQIADRKESSIMIPLVMATEFNVVHGFDVIRGAQEFLFSHSCHLSPHCFKVEGKSPDNYEEVIDHLIERGNRCIMILLPRIQNPEYFRRHIRNGIRFVFLDNPLEDFFGSYLVCSDHAMGGYLVTKHLLDLGHTNIAVFCPVHVDTETNPNYRLRLEGYRKALEERGIVSRPDYFFECVSRGDFAEQIRRMSSLTPRPTAVFCLSDATADMLVEGLREQEIRVPEDVSVAGFDNLQTGNPVTTVQQDFYGLGRYGAELALQLLNHPDYPMTRQTLPVSLIARSTTVRMKLPT